MYLCTRIALYYKTITFAVTNSHGICYADRCRSHVYVSAAAREDMMSLVHLPDTIDSSTPLSNNTITVAVNRIKHDDVINNRNNTWTKKMCSNTRILRRF